MAGAAWSASRWLSSKQGDTPYYEHPQDVDVTIAAIRGAIVGYQVGDLPPGALAATHEVLGAIDWDCRE